MWEQRNEGTIKQLNKKRGNDRARKMQKQTIINEKSMTLRTTNDGNVTILAKFKSLVIIKGMRFHQGTPLPLGVIDKGGAIAKITL